MATRTQNLGIFRRFLDRPGGRFLAACGAFVAGENHAPGLKRLKRLYMALQACRENRKSPGRIGPGHENSRGKLPGLVNFICFVFMAPGAFIIWPDPYRFSVFIMPVVAADGKSAGRAGVLAASPEARAAAAMLKYICYSFFASLRAVFCLFRFTRPRFMRCSCSRFRFMIYDKGH